MSNDEKRKYPVVDWVNRGKISPQKAYQPPWWLIMIGAVVGAVVLWAMKVAFFVIFGG